MPESLTFGNTQRLHVPRALFFCPVLIPFQEVMFSLRVPSAQVVNGNVAAEHIFVGMTCAPVGFVPTRAFLQPGMSVSERSDPWAAWRDTRGCGVIDFRPHWRETCLLV